MRVDILTFHCMYVISEEKDERREKKEIFYRKTGTEVYIVMG